MNSVGVPYGYQPADPDAMAKMYKASPIAHVTKVSLDISLLKHKELHYLSVCTKG
jgi:hypothetical protein